MNRAKILKNNEPKFLKDLKSVTEAGVLAENTGVYFKTLKNEVLKWAETEEIRYYISEDVYMVRRKVMVII